MPFHKILVSLELITKNYTKILKMSKGGKFKTSRKLQTIQTNCETTILNIFNSPISHSSMTSPLINRYLYWNFLNIIRKFKKNVYKISDFDICSNIGKMKNAWKHETTQLQRWCYDSSEILNTYAEYSMMKQFRKILKT